MNTAVVSASRDNQYESSLLAESLASIKETSVVRFDTFNYPDNKRGLSEVYNDFIAKKGEAYDIAVFVHDDVWVDDAFFISKIEAGFEEYDIVGIAGCMDPVIKPPILWHTMASRDKLKGFAGHFSEDSKQCWVTTFGPSPARVALLDGVFLGVNLSKIKTVNWRFNENFDFHCYDLASCIDANKKHLKCGVIPINIIHKSHGLRSLEDPCFKKNQDKFMQIYGN